ncbi:MAG TPA: tetratricopeptide repeat protein [Candidatus Binataceae bacterium]|nr:tetratricopeptide repeat protein [Candidatus Binataceae bacterium]
MALGALIGRVSRSRAFSVESLPGSSPAPLAAAGTATSGAPSGAPSGAATDMDVTAGATPSPSLAEPAAAALPSASDAAPTPMPPALDVNAINTAPDLESASLLPEIKRADTPALAASLRSTEQARVEFGQGDVDAALRDLSRAVSIDPSDPWAYYYLGRVYFQRRNYAQAQTFLQRSELGFAGRPDWLAETLTLEGTCDEELGRTADAARAYQRAVAAAPNNFRAKLGYDRLSYAIATPGALDAGAPSGSEALPPPSAPPPEAPPDEPPPPEDQ